MLSRASGAAKYSHIVRRFASQGPFRFAVLGKIARHGSVGVQTLVAHMLPPRLIRPRSESADENKNYARD
jgi:hypothetical protein